MFRKLFGLNRPEQEATDNNKYNIDTDCNYCPECEDAYRSEIETCPACSVRLIPGAEKLASLRQQDAGLPAHSHSMEISADDDLVAVQTGKLRDIKPLQHLLKAASVPSVLSGDNNSKG